ncbi:MAG: HAD-IIA family hydrolase [Deltaproteobacteria bacterium]|nr:HAD-IIA family hydrolase [Deltaproteobacteria bacterium]
MDLAAKKCLLFDLDGTVYLGEIPIPGTVDFIRRNLPLRDIYFLTNNTSKNPRAYVEKLCGMGIKVGSERILSPLLPLVRHLRNGHIRGIYLVGNASCRAFIAEHMPDVVFTNGPDCQAVVLAYDTELTYEKLAESCLLLQRPDVAFLATHADLVCPSPRGPLPDAGSFTALYAQSTGRTPDLVFGKPNPLILGELPERYAPRDMVMVGDRLYTDKLLAENAGMDFILVLSGESKAEDLAGLARRPDLVVPHLGAF